MSVNLSDSLKLPDSIGTETIAILGRRGSGKSNTATALLEELYAAGQQFVLIDPKGEGWGLKAQGKHGDAGLDVIVFGEPEGDLPLREQHGETVADFVVTSGKSVVLSVAGLDSDAAQRRFVARFAERLFTLKKKPEHHSPLMVVIEEAHLFVPQRVEGAQADVVARLQRLVRQGRSMGLGVTLVDQRPASVNKDVLTQIELMVCHQLTSPHDRKAVDAWIEANAEGDQAAEFQRTLPALQPGEAWIWSPAKLKLFERATIRQRRTFDSGATPVLGRGVKRPRMRDVDLSALRQQLEQVVEERNANDPVELKKTIAALQKQLASKPAAAAAPAPIEKPVVTKAQVKDVERIVDKLTREGERRVKLGEEMVASGRELVAKAGEFTAALLRASAGPIAAATPQRIVAPVVRLTPAPRVAPQPGSIGAQADRAALPGPERKILDAYAWWHSIGVERPSRENVAPIAGYSNIRSSGFRNPLYACQAAGLIADEALSEAGRRVAEWPTGVDTLEQYHAKLKTVVDGPAQRLFDAIVAADGVTTRDGLAAACGYTNVRSTGFRNPLYRLSGMGLVKFAGDRVEATGLMFPPSLAVGR